MAMLNQYFKLQDEYRNKYGEKTILLFQVGAFYEVYTKVDKNTKEITEPQVIEFKKFAELASANKNETTLMLGFRDYMVEKYVEKIQNNGYTCVVYSQDAPTSNTTRSLTGIFSPGTFFSVNNAELSNNIACIWIHKNDKTIFNKHGNIIIGMSCVDIFTGKSNFMEIIAENIHNPTTYDELERFITTYSPSESIIISNMDSSNIDDIVNFIRLESKKIHKLSTNDKIIKNAEKQSYQQEIVNQFFKQTVANSIIENSLEYTYALQSYVYLLNFIYEHNPNLINKIQEPTVENKTDRMILANHSLQQLNIIDDHNYKGKLSSVSNLLNNCITTMGSRSFKHSILNPSTHREKIERKYGITEYLLTTDKYWCNWRKELNNIKDIEKLNRQIYLKKILPKNLYHFYDNLSILQRLFIEIQTDDVVMEYLSQTGKIDIDTDFINICNEFQILFDKTFDMNICKEIDTTDFNNINNNFINKGVSNELDSYIAKCENSERKINAIKDYLNDVISSGEKKKKGEFIKFHVTDKSGMYIQCTSRRSKILQTQLKNTNDNIDLEYANIEGKTEIFKFNINMQFNAAGASNVNITNETINDLCSTITITKQKIKDEIVIIYSKFVDKLQEYNKEFLDIVNFTAEIDLMQNMCYIAKKYNYNKPTILELNENKYNSNNSNNIQNDLPKSYIKATDIRHPLIEQLNTKELYVANDINIGCIDNNTDKDHDKDHNKDHDKHHNKDHDKHHNKDHDKDIMLLYGTNAVGKTSIIRAVGISLIMAQAGLYVPCSTFQYYPYSSIFTRILGNDNLFKGLSTFAVEMSELRVILQLADKNSLILGDELCSGTEHDSAVSIFVSGLELLHNKNASAIFATHLHEIIEYDEIKQMNKLMIKHMTVKYNKEKDVLIYDRKLKDGPGESMYGLEVCKSLHLPDDFLENAYAIRRKYRNEEGILSNKTSHFNSKKIMGKCELCKVNIGSEVHHLQHQEKANKNNIIKTFHKNHPANLLTLCETCHNNIHKTGKEHRKVKTSIGIEITELEEE